MGLTVHGYAVASIVNGKEIRNRTYISWKNMWARCTNENKAQWKDYGGRGISVCSRWAKFENFLEDLGEVPEGLFLERKNNDGNYEPDNCKWATRLEQNQNRRGRFYNDPNAGIGYDSGAKKWRVRFTINKKVTFLGNFLTVEEAREAKRLHLLEQEC